MKKFEEKKIVDMSTIQGGADDKPKTRRTVEFSGFFDGQRANESICADVKEKTK